MSLAKKRSNQKKRRYTLEDLFLKEKFIFFIIFEITQNSNMVTNI